MLPNVISSEGVKDPSWLFLWIQNRKEAGLPVSGTVEGPLLPTPSGTKELGWSKRPVTSTEVTNWLRALLGVDDKQLRSHSLKATTLSKVEIPLNIAAVYSRDLAYAVRALERVIRLIKDGVFFPDATVLQAPCARNAHAMYVSATHSCIVSSNRQPRRRSNSGTAREGGHRVATRCTCDTKDSHRNLNYVRIEHLKFRLRKSHVK